MEGIAWKWNLKKAAIRNKALLVENGATSCLILYSIKVNSSRNILLSVLK